MRSQELALLSLLMVVEYFGVVANKLALLHLSCCLKCNYTKKVFLLSLDNKSSFFLVS